MYSTRFFILAVVLSLATPLRASSSGPALSLQPLLAGKDCEIVPELLGDWTGHGDVSGDWAIQGLNDQMYRLVNKRRDTETGRKSAFDICVAHLGGSLFFDATFG